MYPGGVPFPAIKSPGGGGLGPNMRPAGRPKSPSANALIVLPFAEGAGFKPSMNLNVQSIKSTTDSYIKAGQMPPALQPRRSRPLQHKTNRAISQGFVQKTV